MSRRFTIKMKRMTAQSSQAQAEASELRQKNAQLRMRNPILVLANFNQQAGNQSQIGEDDNCPAPQGKQRPPLDPTRTQDPFWTGDRAIFGSAVATYMVRDAPSCQFKFFLKFIKHPASNPPMMGNVVVQTMDDFQISPVVYNTREQVAIPIAVVSVAGDLKQTVQLAVPKENTVAPGQSPPANRSSDARQNDPLPGGPFLRSRQAQFVPVVRAVVRFRAGTKDASGRHASAAAARWSAAVAHSRRRTGPVERRKNRSRGHGNQAGTRTGGRLAGVRLRSRSWPRFPPAWREKLHRPIAPHGRRDSERQQRLARKARNCGFRSAEKKFLGAARRRFRFGLSEWRSGLFADRDESGDVLALGQSKLVLVPFCGEKYGWDEAAGASS